MLIIDAKGRLFGKINIIDFLVIVFFALILPVFYFAYKIYKRPPVNVEVPETLTEREMTFTLVKVDPEIAKIVKAGDIGVNKNGQKIAEIISVGENNPYRYFFKIGDEKFDAKDQRLREINVKLKITALIRGENIYYNEQQISKNQPVIFRTNKYALKMIPYREEKWLSVTARFSSLSQELSQMINGGHLEKDSEGGVIGRLEKVVSVVPSQVSAVKLEEDKLVFFNDPYRNDVVLLLNLLCTEKDGTLYFKNYPIKIGSQITFSSDMYVVTGQIIGISGI